MVGFEFCFFAFRVQKNMTQLPTEWQDSSVNMFLPNTVAVLQDWL